MQQAQNTIWIFVLLLFVASILILANFFSATLVLYFSSAPEINSSVLALLGLSLFLSVFGLTKETLWTGVIQQALNGTPSRADHLPFYFKWHEYQPFLNHELSKLADAFSRREVVTSEQLDFILGYGFGRNLTQLRFLPQAMVTLGLIGTFTGLSLTMIALSEMLASLSVATGGDAGEAMSQLSTTPPNAGQKTQTPA